MSHHQVASVPPAVLERVPTRPVRAVLALVGLSIGVTVAGSLVVGLVAPASDPLLRRLPVVLALLAMSLVVARRVGWSSLAAGGPSTWRSLGWLAAPVLVALVPLAWGWSPDRSTLAVLVVGYAATGLYEELWFRGVVLRAALPLGPGRAAALTAAVFGASHLPNILFGQNAAVTVAQAVGAATFGFGYAVLRLRTDALWALAATHAVLDLLLHTTGLHGGALWGVMVGQDVVLGVVGLVALRGGRRRAGTQVATQHEELRANVHAIVR
ncbi:MAG: CPBP family intramembrane metalloprotease [Micrococcales bacterium]|nr:CPBP family intramembrane metalloprotease [Micrococcales bacterium]